MKIKNIPTKRYCYHCPDNEVDTLGPCKYYKPGDIVYMPQPKMKGIPLGQYALDECAHYDEKKWEYKRK